MALDNKIFTVRHNIQIIRLADIKHLSILQCSQQYATYLLSNCLSLSNYVSSPLDFMRTMESLGFYNSPK